MLLASLDFWFLLFVAVSVVGGVEDAGGARATVVSRFMTSMANEVANIRVPCPY